MKVAAEFEEDLLFFCAGFFIPSDTTDYNEPGSAILQVDLIRGSYKPITK